MENIIVVFLLILIVFLFLIYKKLDQVKNNDESESKYAVLSEKLNTLTDKASLIPKINLKKIKKVIGIDTNSAVRSGFFLGLCRFN